VPKYAIIDVETTGGMAQKERITEIAIVVHDGSAVLETFSTLLNPERSIPWNITSITGITDDMVKNAPKFYEIAKKVVELTEGAIFVAHNVSFDYGFVREEFARLGFSFVRKQLCTVRMSRKAFPGLPSYSLSNLKKHFKIYAEKSHRALDDTLATVTVFEKILASQESGENLQHFISHGVKESKLPTGITLEFLHSLPESTGVYYLHDKHGEVVYVGKSINIQKRMFEHFADLTPKGEKLREGVNSISFEETGSELVALLLESAEIKRLQPPINRALRIKSYNACIFTYIDQNGYQCLAPGKVTISNKKKMEMVADYPKIESAKGHLQSVARALELCFRLTNLDYSEKACFHYSIKKCHGACVGEESPESYNERVKVALELFDKRLDGSFFLIDEGRNATEKAVVAVVDGVYQGFGFFDIEDGKFTAEDLLESVNIPYKDPEATKIIKAYMEGKKKIKMVKF
jgi:DNA polymerase III subunit epsilon